MGSETPQDQAVLDHLVVAAETLEQGAAYVEAVLGVATHPGGRHATQGTHNRLLSLGRTRYLEVIAVDPAGRKPAGPRWFGLDDPGLRAAVARRPRLITWVARCADIDARVSESCVALGEVRPMQRGHLRWRMTFTPDGGLLETGLIPPLIEWRSASHPAGKLPESGCRLHALYGRLTDPDRVRGVLERLGLAHQIGLRRIGADTVPGLTALIETPDGRRAKLDA